MSSTESIWRRFDYLLFGLTMALVIFGILMIRSATLDAIDPNLINRVPDQIRFALMGLGLIFVLTLIDYRMLGGLHNWLYLLMVGLLALVPPFGVVGDAGARRWLNVGILIQPSEIGKVLIIITLAHHLSTNYQKLGNIGALIRSLIHVMIPVGLIFIQPDLGTTIVFIVIWLVMIWGAGLRVKHIALGAAVGLVSAPLLWSQMEPYQRARITTFLNCTINVCAADDDDYYNIRQAIISIGNGGLTGRGYANGTQGQLRFLRVRHTDFIFSQIAEEFGFIGGMTIMSMIGLVIMRILRGARLAVDPLGSLICYGVAGVIFFQTTVSIGMNLSLLPVTGLTLPFISSGGTSLLSTMAGVGLAQSVIVRRRRVA